MVFWRSPPQAPLRARVGGPLHTSFITFSLPRSPIGVHGKMGSPIRIASSNGQPVELTTSRHDGRGFSLTASWCVRGGRWGAGFAPTTSRQDGRGGRGPGSTLTASRCVVMGGRRGPGKQCVYLYSSSSFRYFIQELTYLKRLYLPDLAVLMFWYVYAIKCLFKKIII